MTLPFTRITRAIVPLVMAGVVTALAGPAAAQSIDKAIATQAQADSAASSSQKRINEIRDRLQDAASRYTTATADAESLEKYNSQLEKQVTAQREEMVSIEKQLLDIETTNREVQPLMQRMVDALERFVALDVPFLLEERTVVPGWTGLDNRWVLVRSGRTREFRFRLRIYSAAELSAVRR